MRLKLNFFFTSMQNHIFVMVNKNVYQPEKQENMVMVASSAGQSSWEDQCKQIQNNQLKNWTEKQYGNSKHTFRFQILNQIILISLNSVVKVQT